MTSLLLLAAFLLCDRVPEETVQSIIRVLVDPSVRSVIKSFIIGVCSVLDDCRVVRFDVRRSNQKVWKDKLSSLLKAAEKSKFLMVL